MHGSDPFCKAMYEAFMEYQDEGRQQLSFFERMKIDELVRKFKEDEEIKKIEERIEQTSSVQKPKVKYDRFGSVKEEGEEDSDDSEAFSEDELEIIQGPQQ